MTLINMRAHLTRVCARFAARFRGFVDSERIVNTTHFTIRTEICIYDRYVHDLCIYT